MSIQQRHLNPSQSISIHLNGITAFLTVEALGVLYKLYRTSSSRFEIELSISKGQNRAFAELVPVLTHLPTKSRCLGVQDVTLDVVPSLIVAQ